MGGGLSLKAVRGSFMLCIVSFRDCAFVPQPIIFRPNLIQYAFRYQRPARSPSAVWVDRRLEWSRCLDGDPCAWTSFNPGTTCHDTQDAPGWFMPGFHIVEQEFLKCRFHKWCAGNPAVAVYAAQELRYCGYWVGYPAGEVYVREVPTALGRDVQPQPH